ncbi:MAG: hypothetical protein WCO65_02850 [bacterium]
MEKNIIQDIKPSSRAGSPNTTPREFSIRKNPARVLPKEIPFTPTPPKSSSKHGLWFLAIACLIVLIVSVSFLFQSATVTIVPKTVMVALDSTDTFTAIKDSKDATVLPYMVMSLSGDTSITLPATQTKNVSNFATGKVTLFNTYSTTPVKIAKGTQLLGSNSQLYKVNSLVSIPGYIKSKSMGNLPGSIDVDITAVVPGEVGNIDTANFTIPMYAKRPQAGKIYAKSKTALSGGLSGVLNTIPQASADTAYQTLKDQLKASLIGKEKVQVPPGYLFFEGATVFETDNAVVAPYSKNPEIPLGLHGKLTAYLIKQDMLTQSIVQKFVNNYNNEPVTIPGISSLVFVPSSTAPLDPNSDTPITFSFTGTVKIIWKIKTDDIKNTLISKDKSGFSSALAAIPGVEKADLVIKPFWKQSFPDDAKKINVDVIYPTN